jgi:hypothetical protein
LPRFVNRMPPVFRIYRILAAATEAGSRLKPEEHGGVLHWRYPIKTLHWRYPIKTRIEERRKVSPFNTILVLIAIGAISYFFGAMLNLPRPPIGSQALTTLAFTDPDKPACSLPEGTRVNIVGGQYEDALKNRWSIVHDKYGRPEIGDFVAYVPITPTRIGCGTRAIKLHSREFVVDK